MDHVERLFDRLVRSVGRRFTKRALCRAVDRNQIWPKSSFT